MAGSITTSVDAPLVASGVDAVAIPGFVVRPLEAHTDARGQLTEFFRASWRLAAISQWTAIALGAGVLRGPSVHVRHFDAVIVLSGEMRLGLRDLRERSPVFRRPYRLTLSDRERVLVVIPPGVMHTFHAANAPALVVVGTTNEYDPADDIKCRWQDAAMDLDASLIGAEDERAHPLDDVIATLRARM
jgi:dTDP-4-dehydrorhamnose 3,5-epimerase-like enzyme